jgi:phosphatidylserine/phosphatidylglycerophosphate/cardiolipin synthase-like enzyme
MQDILNYFVNHRHNLNEKFVPKSATGRIHKLNRNDRDKLKSALFTKAKEFETQTDFSAIDWIQACLKVIDKNAFHFNQVFFSPGHEIKDEIRNLLRRAESSVNLCIFTITDNELAGEIISCYKRGVNVRIITDDEKTEDNGSEIYRLSTTGIPVKIDHSHYHMHNKFGVIDNKFAITGSFNWTYTATKHNQENLLATSKFEIVKQYSEEFEQLWQKLFDL